MNLDAHESKHVTVSFTNSPANSPSILIRKRQPPSISRNPPPKFPFPLQDESRRVRTPTSLFSERSNTPIGSDCPPSYADIPFSAAVPSREALLFAPTFNSVRVCQGILHLSCILLHSVLVPCVDPVSCILPFNRILLRRMRVRLVLCGHKMHSTPLHSDLYRFFELFSEKGMVLLCLCW